MISIVKEILNERRRINSEDYINIEKCWEKLINILSKSEQQTINILEQLDEQEILLVSEVFEEIAYNLQSEKYIECLLELERKYPDISIPVRVAEEYMKNSEKDRNYENV